MDLSTEYLVLDILTNANRLTLQNVTFWGILKTMLISLFYQLLFED